MSKRANSSLNITKKSRRIHLSENYYIMLNDLRLRASRRNTINAVIAFGGGCWCLGTQSCKTIGLLWQTLLRLFRATKTTLQMLWIKIGPLVSQVIILQSHMTWYLFGKCVSIVVYVHFSYRIKSLYYSVVRINKTHFYNWCTSWRFLPGFVSFY